MAVCRHGRGPPRPRAREVNFRTDETPIADGRGSLDWREHQSPIAADVTSARSEGSPRELTAWTVDDSQRCSDRESAERGSRRVTPEKHHAGSSAGTRARDGESRGN